MMKKNKREKRKSKFNAPIVVLVFTILLILFFVMAYMLFHSRSIASLEAEKSVIATIEINFIIFFITCLRIRFR